MYLKKEIREIVHRLCYLESVILEKAEKYADSITVGFTHIAARAADHPSALSSWHISRCSEEISKDSWMLMRE